MQVLEGLETYIATEQFLHKLEQASAEWIDLSEHQHHPLPPKVASDELEMVQVGHSLMSHLTLLLELLGSVIAR